MEKGSLFTAKMGYPPSPCFKILQFQEWFFFLFKEFTSFRITPKLTLFYCTEIRRNVEINVRSLNRSGNMLTLDEWIRYSFLHLWEFKMLLHSVCNFISESVVIKLFKNNSLMQRLAPICFCFRKKLENNWVNLQEAALRASASEKNKLKRRVPFGGGRGGRPCLPVRPAHLLARSVQGTNICWDVYHS